jgi:4-amino-4-deoxychorismate lyase
MFRFLETIKIADGRALNLDLHEERMNRTRREKLGMTDHLSLRDSIPPAPAGMSRWRLVYGKTIEESAVKPYVPKIVRSLRLVVDNTVQYYYKYLDRTCFEKWINGLPPDSDILVVKNGLITDTSFSNIIFWNGSEWITPADPLLRGTKRKLLLQNGIIREEHIRPDDLGRYEYAKLINAMLDPEDTSPVDTGSIVA